MYTIPERVTSLDIYYFTMYSRWFVAVHFRIYYHLHHSFHPRFLFLIAAAQPIAYVALDIAILVIVRISVVLTFGICTSVAAFRFRATVVG